MASLQTSSLFFSSSSLKRKHAATNISKSIRMPLSVPKLSTRNSFQETKGSTDTNQFEENVVSTKEIYDEDPHSVNKCRATVQLFAILEYVVDRVEMHNNIGEQRDNWNTLLLSSINMITLTAAIMSGLAAMYDGAKSLLALKLSSTLLFTISTGMFIVMNKIQPSQLGEEQRNATRLFRALKSHVENTIALGNPTEEDVKEAMEKILALDKAYPLPLLGAMLDKFPSKFEPAVWWPTTQFQGNQKPHVGNVKSKKMEEMSGWSEEP